MPTELRLRIYRHYFTRPVVSLWNHMCETPLGFNVKIKRTPEEQIYRRLVADDYVEDDYEYRNQWVMMTVGWLEDYRSLFGTCRTIKDEAREVLGSLLHLKILAFWHNSTFAPHSLPRLYYQYVQQVTVLCCHPEDCYKPIWPDIDLMHFEYPSLLPSLKCLRLILPEARKTVLLINPDTAGELIDYLLGVMDKWSLDGLRDSLITSHERPVPVERTGRWSPWLRDVLYEKKAQPFRVTRREIFDVYATTEPDAEAAYDNARHLIKMVRVMLFGLQAQTHKSVGHRVRRHYLRHHPAHMEGSGDA